jgi:DNA-directed RNA polymerase specialized sigma subunit
MYAQTLEQNMNNKQEKSLNMKSIENILKNLKQYEAKTKEIELQIADLKDMQYLSLKGIDYENFIKTDDFFSKTEIQALKDFEIQHKIDLLEFEKRHIERFLKRIYNAMESLTDIEKQIIEMKYIEKKIWRYITFEINLEERQCREIKNKAIRKIIKLLKGSAFLKFVEVNMPKKCRN